MDNTFIEGSEPLQSIITKMGEFNKFTFDLESTGLNPIDSRILLCQIGFPDHNYVIDVSKVNLTPLMPFFNSPKWTKVIQNAKFDTKFLLHHYNTKTRGIFDTYLAERLISSDEFASAGLKALALKYSGITLDKDIRDSFINMKAIESFSDEQLGYAAQDVAVLWAIMEAQEAKLQELGMGAVAELEFELAPIVAHMELVGVPIDQDKWKQKLADYAVKHEESRIRMNDLLFDGVSTNEQLGMFARDSINLNSPKQIKEAFLKIGINLKDGTAERELAVIDHPAAKEMLHYRELQKILTSYGKTFLDKIHPFTGHVHADFQQLGTGTGRFACKDPNLQQMPDEFRQCVTEKDYKIVAADYAGIELRILAELSGDKNLIGAFESGVDLHRSTAAMMFNIHVNEVTPEQRFIGKTLNFGISYGMGPYKLMDTLNHGKTKKEQLGFKRVAEMHARYKEIYSEAVDWLYNAGNLAFRQSYSTTILGRRRFYNRPTNADDRDKQIAAIKRQGANSPIQGSSADMTKMAMLNLYADLNMYGFKANMILQVHDEIGVLAHKSQAEEIKSVIVESMMKSGQDLLKKVPIKVEAYSNDVWKKKD